MLCPSCHNETDSGSLFCHVCDAYRTDPSVGSKANVGVRLLALALDMAVGLAIFATISVASCAIIGMGAAAMPARDNSGLVGALGLGTFFFALIAWIVFLLFFLGKGKTPGKAMAGLRVADKRNGSLPGIGRMLLRETIGKWLSGFFLALGYFWAIFDRDAQAWHDKIAGTIVVKTNAAGQLAGVGNADTRRA